MPELRTRGLRRSQFPRKLCAIVTTTLAASFSSTAFAQSASDQAAAEALFKQGRDLMGAGQYASACPKFVESERLDPAPGTLLNLATCYEHDGQIASAWVTYKEAATAARNADQPERARMARDKAAAIEPTLPLLTIVVTATSERPSLQIRRDGEVVGRAEWGTPIPVDPGTHVVEASSPGFASWQSTVAMAGQSAKASVEVPALTPLSEPAPAAAPETEPRTIPLPAQPPGPVVPIPAPPAPAPDTHRGSAQRIAGIVFGGVGLAGLAASGLFGGLALAQKNAAAGECVASVCDTTGDDDLRSARRFANGSTIAVIAGGALFVTGVVLFATAPAGKPATLAIAPFAGPGAAGAAATGAF